MSKDNGMAKYLPRDTEGNVAQREQQRVSQKVSLAKYLPSEGESSDPESRKVSLAKYLES
ncbi:hypothetical protein [Corynebacterium sp. A21]|uniref:hypothetical protein n=1 Tax=Corynebacterium sp. A21 TaxID=3457318 RepID=UPI003FD2FBA0